MPSPFKTAPIPETVEQAQERKDLLDASALAELAAAENLNVEEVAKVVAAEPKKPEKKIKAKVVEEDGEEKPVELSEAELADLDESTLFKYNIVAKSLTDSAMVTIRPKLSSISFRWVYFNNGVVQGSKDKITASNVARYKYMGFDFASIDDVDGGEDSLLDGIIEDGGKIINFDTVLMKIDKIRLMGHYKKSLTKSFTDVDQSLGKALKGAENDIAQTSAYQKALAMHPKAKIEFYNPTA